MARDLSPASTRDARSAGAFKRNIPQDRKQSGQLRTWALACVRQFAVAVQASGPDTSLQTCVFQGNCEDCADNDGVAHFPVTASLALKDDAPGQGSFGLAHVVSFSCAGSNLVLDFVWTASSMTSVSGSLSGPPAGLIFDVNLRPVQGSRSDWGYDKFPGDKIFLSSGGNHGDQDKFDLGYEVVRSGRKPSKDFGTGTWSAATSISPVPEPGVVAMLLAGMGLLGLMAPRLRAALSR